MAQRKSIEYNVEALDLLSVGTRTERHCDHISITRLIVLVPARGIDNSALARKIWMLAEPCAINVLFLGLNGHQPGDEGDVRLSIANLASMTRDEHIQVDTHLEPDDSWVRAVHRVWQPGDTVICLAEHKVNIKHHGDYPLSTVLDAILDVPVYVIPGLYLTDRVKLRNEAERIHWVEQELSQLLVPFLILGTFLLMQIGIGDSTSGVLRTVLLSVSGLAEVGVLGVWASLSH
jgi:hypothetical protein